MGELISQSKRSLIYKDIDPSNENKFIIWKIANQSSVGTKALLNEFEICRILGIKGISQPIEKAIYKNREGFAYDYIKGKTLRSFLQKGTPSLRTFFRIAIKLAGLVKLIHNQGICHLGLNSNHIIYDEDSNEISVIDFTLANEGGSETLMDLQELDDELAYVSPEQVGSLTNEVDNRSDLYALGVIFYEILIGEPPYTYHDPISIIHAHLVQAPPNPSKIDTRIPGIVGQLIIKLLAKKPSDRYQSAYGLIHDLEVCLLKLKNDGGIDPFELGVQDQSSKPKISNALYGRTTAIENLAAGIRDAVLGQKNSFLVSGNSGVGKSALLNHLPKMVHETDGIILLGAFDYEKSNIPHHAMVTVLRKLASYILSGSEAQLKEWKATIEAAIGENGQVLIDLVPDFKWIIGEQKPSSELTGIQAESRVLYLLQRLFQEVSYMKRPLVLCFDDIQWADQASLKTIRALVQNNNIEHLMMVVTLDNSSIENSEKVNIIIHEIRENISTANRISLENVSPVDVNEFIADSFHVENVSDLGQIVYAKTRGNPLFLHQFFDKLLRDKKLTFKPETRKWIWDQNDVQAIEISGNISDYKVAALAELPENDKEILAYAACIGPTFNLSLLAAICAHDLSEIKSTLDDLLSEKFLALDETGSYSFLNNELRMAAYQFVTENRKSKIHHSIAQILLAQTENLEDSIQVFNLSNQFKLGRDLVDPADRMRVIGINYQAGQHAGKIAAFDLALNYYLQGIASFQETDWETHYELGIDLYLNAAEAAMISGKADEGNQFLDRVLDWAKNGSDRLRANELRLEFLSERHQFEATIDLFLSTVKEIGYEVKRNPNKLQILKELVQVKWLLRGKSMDDILGMPAMEHPAAQSYMKLVFNATTSIFGNAPDILPVVFLKLVRLSLKYGNSTYSPFAYAFYGFIISVFMEDLTGGYQFGRMALKMADAIGTTAVKTRVNVVNYGFLNYWEESFRESVEPLRQTYDLGRQCGDLQYASFAASFYSSIRLHAGDNLKELYEIMTRDCVIMKNLNQDLVYNISESQRQWVINLLRITENPLELKDEVFEEDAYLKMLEEKNDEASKFDFYYYKMTLACLFHQYGLGFENCLLAEKFEDETSSRQITFPSFLVFASLSAIKQLNEETPVLPRKKLLRSIKKKINLLRTFTKHANQNFSNKLHLTEAFLYDETNQSDKAISLYLLAIKEADHSGFLHEEALAREYLAYHYKKIGFDEFFDVMLIKAYNCYFRWGALAKCNQLKNKFPTIIRENSSVNQNAGGANLQNIFDLNTIISSNRALSQENSLEGLLLKMIGIVIENASADKAIIIMRDDRDQWKAKVIGSLDGTHIVSGVDNELEKLFPPSLVNLVARTSEPFTSGNLSADDQFGHDDYLRTVKPLSACAIPIIVQKSVLGVVYLENNQTQNAFSIDRVEFFRTISSQLGVSLQNVLLYSEMEQKVKDRTFDLVTKNDELIKEKQKSDDLLLNILPADVAAELKNYGKTTARNYPQVTVLFSDIKDFSSIARQLSPEDLVSELDFCFKEFDKICETFHLEKIKTVGDAYIAACGLADKMGLEIDVIKAALAMQKIVKERMFQRKENGLPYFELRIGITTGPVVAGVVGSKKFQFDIWGDTVNISARLQESCDPGRVNISKETYEKVKAEIRCIHRGKIEAKNIGKIDMYFVEA